MFVLINSNDISIRIMALKVGGQVPWLIILLPFIPGACFCVSDTLDRRELLTSKHPRWKHSEARSWFPRVTLSAEVKQPTVLVLLGCSQTELCVLCFDAAGKIKPGCFSITVTQPDPL